jgi:hypothetical protein
VHAGIPEREVVAARRYAPPRRGPSTLTRELDTSMGRNGAGPEREWVTFADPDDEGRSWQLDVTFLTSHWHCIFGCGCQGVRDVPSPERSEGCCSYGAHFADAKDRDRVVRVARRLTADEWQHRAEGRRGGVVASSGRGSWRTRRVAGACIFLNRPGFPAGPGCALHLLAERQGVHFSETKPEVCWQLPVRRVDSVNDDGTVTSTVGEFGRSGWGPGGQDFAWWCTEAPEAFTAGEPVYRTLEAELRKTCGDAVYERLAGYLDERLASTTPPVRHPAEVPVTLRRRR